MAVVSRDMMKSDAQGIDPSLCWNMPVSFSRQISDSVNYGQGPNRSGLHEERRSNLFVISPRHK